MQISTIGGGGDEDEDEDSPWEICSLDLMRNKGVRRKLGGEGVEALVLCSSTLSRLNFIKHFSFPVQPEFAVFFYRQLQS